MFNIRVALLFLVVGGLLWGTGILFKTKSKPETMNLSTAPPSLGNHLDLKVGRSSRLEPQKILYTFNFQPVDLSISKSKDLVSDEINYSHAMGFRRFKFTDFSISVWVGNSDVVASRCFDNLVKMLEFNSANILIKNKNKHAIERAYIFQKRLRKIIRRHNNVVVFVVGSEVETRNAIDEILDLATRKAWTKAEFDSLRPQVNVYSEYSKIPHGKVNATALHIKNLGSNDSKLTNVLAIDRNLVGFEQEKNDLAWIWGVSSGFTTLLVHSINHHLVSTTTTLKVQVSGMDPDSTMQSLQKRKHQEYNKNKGSNVTNNWVGSTRSGPVAPAFTGGGVDEWYPPIPKGFVPGMEQTEKEHYYDEWDRSTNYISGFMYDSSKIAVERNWQVMHDSVNVHLSPIPENSFYLTRMIRFKTKESYLTIVASVYTSKAAAHSMWIGKQTGSSLISSDHKPNYGIGDLYFVNGYGTCALLRNNVVVTISSANEMKDLCVEIARDIDLTLISQQINFERAIKDALKVKFLGKPNRLERDDSGNVFIRLGAYKSTMASMANIRYIVHSTPRVHRLFGHKLPGKLLWKKERISDVPEIKLRVMLYDTKTLWMGVEDFYFTTP